MKKKYLREYWHIFANLMLRNQATSYRFDSKSFVCKSIQDLIKHNRISSKNVDRKLLIVNPPKKLIPSCGIIEIEDNISVVPALQNKLIQDKPTCDFRIRYPGFVAA